MDSQTCLLRQKPELWMLAVEAQRIPALAGIAAVIVVGSASRVQGMQDVDVQGDCCLW